MWTCCWHITSVILDFFENSNPKITSTPTSSKTLFLFSAGRRPPLPQWVQCSVSLLPVPKSWLGHGLYLRRIPFSTDWEVCTAPGQGCAAYFTSVLCSPPEQANAFSLFPVKRVKCCGSGNFLQLQIARKGSAAMTLQQCSPRLEITLRMQL